jgi:uncharacterized protein (TIGR00730 family)
MGELADSVTTDDYVTGIIPSSSWKEEEHRDSQPDRGRVHASAKSQMADMSDGFIALPGGIGTLEASLDFTWGQLGIHAKPSAILNVAGYFDELTGFLDHAVREGFLTEVHRHAIMVESDPGRLLQRMRAYIPPEGAPLMGRTHR